MRTIHLLLIATFFYSCKSSSPTHEFYGRWTLKFKDGSNTEARFRKDGTHDYYVNGKLFSSGKFSFRNDTLKEFDPICGADKEYYATYKVDFITADSMRFTALEDSCPPRKYDMDKAILVRIKDH